MLHAPTMPHNNVATIVALMDTQEAFTANFINGAKLKHVNASSLPNMGISNFEHIKVGTVLDVLRPNSS